MTATRIQRTLNRGYQRHLAGDTRSAAASYAEVLQDDPLNADAWHLSGLVAFQKSQYSTAEQLIRHSLRIRSDNPDCRTNLAAVLLALGRPAESAEECWQILHQDPGCSGALKHLGSALRKLHRLPEAVEICRQAVALCPNDTDALCNLGGVLHENGLANEALDVLLTARSLIDDVPQIHLNLGVVQRQLGLLNDAKTSLDRAVELAPGLAEAFANRGNLWLEKGHPDRALDDYQRALALNPRSVCALSGLGQSLQTQGRWSDAMDAFRCASLLTDKVRPGDPASPAEPGEPQSAAVQFRLKSNLLYCASLAPGVSRSTMFEIHADWGRTIEHSISPFAHRPGGSPEKTLRIGYVSPDFRRHPTMRFFLPFFAAHDHHRVDTVCYSESVRVDDVTEKVRSRATEWRCTYGMSERQLAEVVAKDRIDVLVDLAGHTSGNRLPCFAYQPAPIQVSFLGYPNTTGLSRVNYFLTDAVRENAESAQLFTEQLVAMPHGACCFEIGHESVPLSAPPAIRNGYVTLGSTHRLEKLSPQCLQLWAAVMERLPESRLLLIRDVIGQSEPLRNSLQQRLQDAGIDIRRVQLDGAIPACHLEVYSRIDILLDVFPWPSGTTAYEAMWMGVPMPAISGQLEHSAASASCLIQMGYSSLVATSQQDYVNLLSELASDIERMCELRQCLRRRMQETVCDGVRFCRDIEAVYQAMWRRHCGLTAIDSGLSLIEPHPGRPS